MCRDESRKSIDDITDRDLLLILLRAIRVQGNRLKEIHRMNQTAIGEIGALSAKFDTLNTAVAQFSTDASALLQTIKTGTLSAEAMVAATALEGRIDALTATVTADDAAINPTSGATSGSTVSGAGGGGSTVTGGSSTVSGA